MTGLNDVRRFRCHLVEHRGGNFGHAVELGYSNVPLFRNDPWLEPLRSQPAFQAAVAAAEQRHQAALAANRARVLSLPVSAPAR